MPVETFSYLDSLVATNPVTSEGIVNGDDHIRGIKSTLLATFPSITGAVTATHTEINAIAATLVGGVLRANGAVPPGAVMDFATATAPTGWLECNGAAVSRTTYADLFAEIGTAFGVGDGSTTFNLPPDRYRVGKNTAGAAVGTLQASQNKAHTHTGSGTTGAVSNDHTHAFSGSTGVSGTDHSHNYSLPQTSTAVDAGADKLVFLYQFGSAATGGMSANHAHSFSGTTGGISANHSHTYSFTTASDGGTDARPLSAVYLTCIKT